MTSNRPKHCAFGRVRNQQRLVGAEQRVLTSRKRYLTNRFSRHCVPERDVGHFRNVRRGGALKSEILGLTVTMLFPYAPKASG